MTKSSTTQFTVEAALTSALPLDEAYQSINLYNRTVILSVSDAPVQLGPGTELGDTFTDKNELAVFAESVLLAGSVKGNSIGMSAHSLTVADTPELNVSGACGGSWPATPTGDGQPGKKAAAAGVLWAALELISGDALQLKLTARGGDGGPGQSTSDGTGGTGADGAKGGSVQVVIGTPFEQLLPAVDAIFDIDAGGDPVRTLAKKRTTILSLLPALQSVSLGRDMLSTLVTRLGTAVSDPAQTTAGLERLLNLVDERLRVETDIDTSAIMTGIDVSGGTYGTYGTGTKANGANGNPGTAGSRSVKAVLFDPAAMRAVPFAFAHPDQCEMLLQKASALYYAGDLPSLQAATALLERLSARLAFAPALVATDDLYKAYTDQGASLFMTNPIPALVSTFHTASGLLRQLRLGHDYYGRSYSYTPRGSYSFYDQQSQRLLDNLSSIEQTYSDYFTAQRKQAADIDTVLSSLNFADRMTDEAQSNIQLLKADADKTATSIAAWEPVIKQKHQHVKDLIDQAKEQIRKSVSINFADVVEALTMVAFAPNIGMTGLQLGNLLYKAGTQIPDDSGVDVNKAYLVDSISDVEATEEGLLEGFRLRDDGTLEVEDPGAAKLIAAEDKLMDLLNHYRTKLSELDDLKTAFDDYIKSVIDRNNIIIHYNAVIALWIKYQDQIEYYAHKKAQLTDGASASVNPNLPLVTTYMARMYRDSKSQVLESLFLTQRALRFWSLTNVDAIQQSLGGTQLSSVTYASLLKIQSNLLQQFSSAVENYGHDAQVFPSPSASSGMIYPLSASQISSLKANNGVIINIPAVYPETSKADSPFAGWANIRLTKVRVWVNGAKTQDNALLVSIRHFGAETIVDQSGSDFNFSHDPVEVGFEYDLATKSISEDGDISQNEGKTYALFGPFATWRIFIDPNYNLSLDLSSVTDVHFEFFGTNYLFH